jgi:hypothetical protein
MELIEKILGKGQKMGKISIHLLDPIIKQISSLRVSENISLPYLFLLDERYLTIKDDTQRYWKQGGLIGSKKLYKRLGCYHAIFE